MEQGSCIDSNSLLLHITPCCGCASSRNVQLPSLVKSSNKCSAVFKFAASSKDVFSKSASGTPMKGWKYLTWPSPGNWRKFKLFWIITLLLSTAVVDGLSCRVEQCSREFTTSMDSSGVASEPSRRYCSILREYSSCLVGTARACRGNLKYHSTSSLVVQMLDTNHCSGMEPDHDPDPDPDPDYHLYPQESEWKPEWLDPHDGSQCHVRLFPGGAGGAGGGPMTHCALWGDPHLQTFHGATQTCQLLGAWPLVDNDHLAVQVSNEPISDGALASAITEVTVSVRGAEECELRKTYQASGTAPLPTAFTDGTARGGEGDVAVSVAVRAAGRHVEIRARFLSTTVTVRRIGGRYLAVSVAMPAALARTTWERGDGDLLELCSRGCPASQIIDVGVFLSDPARHLPRLTPRHRPAMPRDVALHTCRHSPQLTDHYLDSCVFDLLLTGEARWARRGAQAALRDYLRALPDTAPGTLRNRTGILTAPQYPGSSSLFPSLATGGATAIHHTHRAALQLTAAILVILAPSLLLRT